MSSKYPGAVPYLVYRDAVAAIDFLVSVFGFELGNRLDMQDGSVAHCELRIGSAAIMISSEFASMGLASPIDQQTRYSQVMVMVENVDDHHRKAQAAGANITAPPQEQPFGDKLYRVSDPEGHRWIFSQHIREVPASEWMKMMS